MNRISFLGELEQMVLLAVLRLGPGSYGVAVRAELRLQTGRVVSRGAVYVTLDRLVTKGYLRAWLGEPTHERGGRAKRHFEVTGAGTRALRASRAALQQLWDGQESALDGS